MEEKIIQLKMAEMAVDVRKGTGLPIPSRRGNYVLPGQEDWRRVRSAFGLAE